MISKINYIHHNPIKRGYVDEATHWRYSSARNYEGIDSLLEIERFWGSCYASLHSQVQRENKKKCLLEKQ